MYIYILCVCVYTHTHKHVHTCMHMHSQPSDYHLPYQQLLPLFSDFHNDCLFLAQKKTILIPNAENKDRRGALRVRNLNLRFFYGGKKRQLWKSEYLVPAFCDSPYFFWSPLFTAFNKSPSSCVSTWIWDGYIQDPSYYCEQTYTVYATTIVMYT